MPTLNALWQNEIKKDVDEEWLEGRLVNWNHAFAIVDWFKGGNFKVEVVEIINGKTSLWGELIDGK